MERRAAYLNRVLCVVYNINIIEKIKITEVITNICIEPRVNLCQKILKYDYRNHSSLMNYQDESLLSQSMHHGKADRSVMKWQQKLGTLKISNHDN